MDRHDVRMLELARDLRFGDEAVAVHRLLCQLAVQPLQRHVPEQVAVGRRMNPAHAAATELSVNDQVLGDGNTLGANLLR